MNLIKKFAAKHSGPAIMLPGEAAGIAHHTATVAAELPAMRARVAAGLAEAEDLVKQAAAALVAGRYIEAARCTKRAANLRSLCKEMTRELAAFQKKYDAARAFATSFAATSMKG